jgi:hypothetical protein
MLPVTKLEKALGDRRPSFVAENNLSQHTIHHPPYENIERPVS